ncbi:putative cysteine-rich receptor-like protein kinase 35 [Papaver somniferum]|uniref:putative cysteine-rich receptor-like protein kinase 35 n=1 Tax=Papaver somniferum TaxID=3469 RepID=UPI000E6FFF8E|nr:putative cysteine-rich receptor-like protein kinase 35 [Papaver somniferum]
MSLKVLLVIVVPTVFTVVSIITILYFCIRRKKIGNIGEIQSAESLQFKFSAISVATNNFSDVNKLGRGGFGIVYKGTLTDGQEITVKRLSENSGQGEKEFKNEVALLIKLQHKNLVRLLGYCLHGDEKLLIFEFMKNGSLDQFLFDPVKRAHLDWERRHMIIGRD